MSTKEVSKSEETISTSVAELDMKLEVVVIPVSDVDRVKEFYSRLGWRLDEALLHRPSARWREDGRHIQSMYRTWRFARSQSCHRICLCRSSQNRGISLFFSSSFRVEPAA
jgi:hypothetical protein